MSHPFRIYNTLSKKTAEFEPIKPGHVGIYVCGMTVYDHCHVGHARAMVVFDNFVRYLRHRGWGVTFVRNFTDVDDKIINRANEIGTDPVELAANFIEAFQEDATNLGLIPPDHEPRVSQCIPEIQAMISELIDHGHAYVEGENVWFEVSTDNNYGQLSKQKVDELRNPDDFGNKRRAADFALWKAAKPGEPAWDSPWGKGRPGWHIECSAMAKHSLGAHIDIHGGGLDLVFPHHENEIAQSQCANQCDYVNYWMHNGLLTMASGQKMGKSLGNVINVRVALETFPAEALRLYYLQNHYRSPLPWGPQALPDALGMLARLYDAREVAEAMGGEEDADQVAKDLGADAKTALELGRSLEEKFYKAMDDDFNTAQALGYVFELARAINRFSNHKKARKRGGPVVAPALKAFALVAEALAVLASDTASFQAEVKAKRVGSTGLTVEQIEALLEERLTARAEKNWGRADEIRAELDANQILLMDKPEGVEWRVRLDSPSDD